jgi:hypothetical protein
MTFSLLSKSNSKIDGNQITFGVIDFQPHPQTLALAFANLDQEMNLTIGRFNFCIGSLGSVLLSDPIKLGPSAGKTAITATLETSVGSSSEVSSSVSIKPTKGNTVEELNEIMENLDLEESSGYQDISFDGNSNHSNSYSKEDFMVCYSNISNNSEDTWKSGLELYDDEQTIFSSGSNRDVHSQYQVYTTIDDSSEELDGNNNPIINLANIRRGGNHMAEGGTTESVANRAKVQLIVAEWETIRAAVDNGAAIPMQGERYFWDITIRCHDNHNSWRRRKVKSGKGESQSVWQAKHSTQKEAMHHTQIGEGTTCPDVGWTTLSTLTEGIYHEILIHLSYQSMNEGILYPRHPKWHS